MMGDDFSKAFEVLTGNKPFPWQRALYEDWFAKGDFPSSCNLPTGLGKTNVIAVWLIALIHHPGKVPRRLVYVVNRRTVVDQTTDEVEKLHKNLPKLDCLPEHFQQLAISTLRGQFADNRAWSADPSRPAVICGTVDMIGSRLLFSGYGVGFRTRPLHAGFLGQDALLVHDEAHLEPAFQKLVEAIKQEQDRCRDFRPLRVMELTATSRRSGDVFALKKEDFNNDTVKKRMNALKVLELHEQTDSKKLADQIAALAMRHKDSEDAILIYARTIEDVMKVRDQLDNAKLKVDMLTGTMRGRERGDLINRPIFQRFLPEVNRDDNSAPETGAVYLVCTSAGEVGVNISAAQMVCDLSTFESMAQRFGRVNRFGNCDDTHVDVVYPKAFDEKDKLTPSRQATLNLLKHLEGDASPAALSKLSAELCKAAFAPEPTILPATDILFDAWSMTSIQGKLPGRPPVEPYLHGIRDYEPDETRVAWREEVGVIVGDLLADYPPPELLEDYPLKPHELLRDRTDRVWKEISKLANRHPDKPAWIMDEGGAVEVIPSLSKLAMLPKKDGEARIANKTVLLPQDVGGLTQQGTLDGDALVPKSGEPLDVADLWESPLEMRHRQWQFPEDDVPRVPSGMKPVRQIVVVDPDDEDAKPIKTWHWFVRVFATDADARSRKPYPLSMHLNDAKEAIEQFVSGLSLNPQLGDAVILAAQCHDLGKDRRRWQNGIGNDKYPNIKWAKSGKRRGKIERSPYRHEFGSLLDFQRNEEFRALSEDSQDLILHLIAAHHGRARPHFTADETLDDNYPDEATREQSVDVLRRFARLQRKYGRWGLAYLESLVRAADYAASAKADSTEGGAT